MRSVLLALAVVVLTWAGVVIASGVTSGGGGSATVARSSAAAAGGSQATATALSTAYDSYSISGNDNSTGVTLPTGSSADCMQIMARVIPDILGGADNALLVFGHNSDNDTINGQAADTAYFQAGGTSVTYCTTDGVAWFSY